MGRFRTNKKFPETISHKISEGNPSFHVKQRTIGEVEFVFFKSFLLVLTKLSFWQGDQELGYHSMKFFIIIINLCKVDAKKITSSKFITAVIKLINVN